MNNVLLILTGALLAQTKNLESPRQARWFNTYTSTEIATNLVTSYIPSSCVQVEPTLPPCRNVRYLKFPNFVAKPNPQNVETIKEGKSIHTTELGWGEYLGIYAPTVTVTHTELKTTTVEDPRIVVTFAVKGCRPLRLPMDLNRCEVEASSTVAIQEIIPTSTVASHVVPTANYEEVGSIHDIIDNDNHLGQDNSLLQPSGENHISGPSSNEPTEALPSTAPKF